MCDCRRSESQCRTAEAGREHELVVSMRKASTIRSAFLLIMQRTLRPEREGMSETLHLLVLAFATVFIGALAIAECPVSRRKSIT
jgi:hypothetical protein